MSATTRISCFVLFAVLPGVAAASVSCVNSTGSGGCQKHIQAAVTAAAPGDVIYIWPGTYKEEVTIGKPLSLLAADGDDPTVIDATGLAHGIFVDGLSNPGLRGVTLAGLTVKNAQFEGVLVVSAADVTIRNNSIVENDKSSGLSFTGATTGCPGQPGNGIYENDETGDCGGGLHLIGTVDSTVANNDLSRNADGLLLSDETGETRHVLVTGNNVVDNALECGIVLASHAPMGHVSPPFAAHFGVDNNTILNNLSKKNGVAVGGAGVGLFSDGNGQGRVSGNVVIGNKLIGNGIGGVAMHSHVGPNFGLPADDFSGTQIIGNYIAANLADTDDTATPGRVGINVNSGEGGTPITGMVISGNTIRDEDVDIAINTPAIVDVHLNNLLGGKVGVQNVCQFDYTANSFPGPCLGTINATQNFWGCAKGPGSGGCTTAGAGVAYTPWLTAAVPSLDGDNHDQDH